MVSASPTEELSWFFYESEAALSLSSNFANQIAVLKLGVAASHSPNDPEDFFSNSTLQDIAKSRRILTNLQKLSPISNRVLAAAFSENPNPPPIRVYFSLHLELLAMTEEARKADNPKQAVQSALLQKGKRTAKQIEKEAKAMYQSALQEYELIANTHPEPTRIPFHPGLSKAQ